MQGVDGLEMPIIPGDSRKTSDCFRRTQLNVIQNVLFVAQLNDGSETRSIRILRMAFIKSAFVRIFSKFFFFTIFPVLEFQFSVFRT